jgi:UDPglucose 6-dehydrogenase
MENVKQVFPERAPEVYHAKSPYDAVEKANALLLITEWDEFKDMDLKRIKGLMANPIFMDGRNVFDPAQMKELGFDYYSIGRK